MAIHKNTLNNDINTGIEPGTAGRRAPLERLHAKKIIGYDVRNPQGDNLGKIDNLMVNLAKGEIEYVVIEFGAFLGVGGKLFAVPFKELTLDAENKVFILDREKDYLKQSPGFDKDHWPATNDHSYFDNVSMYYGSYLPPFP